MEKERKSVDTEKNQAQSTLILTREKEEEFITCDMCGHANSIKASLCKMCSNYLKGAR